MQGSKDKLRHYLVPVLFILMGIVFITYTKMDVKFISRFFAFVFALSGIGMILSYIFKDIEAGYFRLDLVYGVMALFVAILCMTKQDIIETYFPMLIGSIIFANGVIKLQHSIDMKRIDRKMKTVTERWLVVMIFALVCIACGAITIYLLPSSGRTLFIFVGASLLFAGATDIFTHVGFSKKLKTYDEIKNGEKVSEEVIKEDAKEETVVTCQEEKPQEEPKEEPKEESVEEPQEVREEEQVSTDADQPS